jgi:hypothetical protein
MQLSPDARRAYGVLFGAAALATMPPRDELVAAAKAAFKKHALATHPDRARTLGRPAEELAREFVRVRQAFETLLAAVNDVEQTPTPRAAPVAPTRPAPTPPATAATATTAVPRRSLRFAEFLFFRGAISWRALGEAIAWQRAQRPSLGELAVSFGYLARAEVDALLVSRRAERMIHVPIGEWARRKGKLTVLQCATLVGVQRRRQRRIGEYFVEHAHVSASELARLVEEHRAHQRAFGA